MPSVSVIIPAYRAAGTLPRAVASGAKVFRPLQDQFYGDRSGTLIDPFGHKWTVATHKEDVSMEEMNLRMAAMK